MIQPSSSKNYVADAISVLVFALIHCVPALAAGADAPSITLKDAKVGDWAEYEMSAKASDESKPVVSRFRQTIAAIDGEKVTVRTAVLDESGKAMSFTAFETRRDAPYGPQPEMASERAEKVNESDSEHRLAGTAIACKLLKYRIKEGSSERTLAVHLSQRVPLGGVVKVETTSTNGISIQTLMAFGNGQAQAAP